MSAVRKGWEYAMGIGFLILVSLGLTAAIFAFAGLIMVAAWCSRVNA
jgi:hypothetical protein